MKQYSFLEESQNKFFKRLSRYTPQEQKKIINKLFEIGKENGGFLDRSELASRIYDGQLKRIGNLAKKNGRRVSVSKDNYRPSWKTIINRLFDDSDISKYSNFFTNPKAKKSILKGKDLLSIPKKRGKIIGDVDKSLINRADILSHEADEYSEILRWARKYKISPEESFLRSAQQSPKLSHQLGNVLNRENKRSKKWLKLFPDFKRMDRSVPEFRMAKQKLKNQPLSKEYQDLLISRMKNNRFYNQS